MPTKTAPKKDYSADLIKSNLLLQSKLADLAKSNIDLTKEISGMVNFFKEAGKYMEAESKEEELRPLFEKINELVEQNKTIARGLILIQKYIQSSTPSEPPPLSPEEL